MTTIRNADGNSRLCIDVKLGSMFSKVIESKNLYIVAEPHCFISTKYDELNAIYGLYEKFYSITFKKKMHRKISDAYRLKSAKYYAHMTTEINGCFMLCDLAWILRWHYLWERKIIVFQLKSWSYLWKHQIYAILTWLVCYLWGVKKYPLYM